MSRSLTSVTNRVSITTRLPSALLVRVVNAPLVSVVPTIFVLVVLSSRSLLPMSGARQPHAVAGFPRHQRRGIGRPTSSASFRLVHAVWHRRALVQAADAAVPVLTVFWFISGLNFVVVAGRCRRCCCPCGVPVSSKAAVTATAVSLCFLTSSNGMRNPYSPCKRNAYYSDPNALCIAMVSEHTGRLVQLSTALNKVTQKLKICGSSRRAPRPQPRRPVPHSRLRSKETAPFLPPCSAHPHMSVVFRIMTLVACVSLRTPAKSGGSR